MRANCRAGCRAPKPFFSYRQECSLAKTTAERIDTACNELLAEGREPTVRAVQERLGGGSCSTISPVARTLKGRARPAYPAASRPAVPDAITARLEAISAELMQLARNELDAQRQGIFRYVIEADGERDAAEARNRCLARELDEHELTTPKPRCG